MLGGAFANWEAGQKVAIKRYAYYHCQGGCTRVTKEAMEQQFEDFVRQLQPNAGYLRLYREIVLDTWRTKEGDGRKAQAVLSGKIRKLRENKAKLEEVFVYQKSIDATT